MIEFNLINLFDHSEVLLCMAETEEHGLAELDAYVRITFALNEHCDYFLKDQLRFLKEGRTFSAEGIEAGNTIILLNAENRDHVEELCRSL